MLILLVMPANSYIPRCASLVTVAPIRWHAGGKKLDKFYVTDFAQFTIDEVRMQLHEILQYHCFKFLKFYQSQEAVKVTNQPCAESLISALKALQIRKQVCMLQYIYIII